MLAPADLDDLDAAATLTAVEDVLVQRRTAEARDLALGAHWADLHAADPQLGPGGRRVWAGEDRLVQVGGEGTPLVQELCLSELAIARRVHHHSARATVADALDLRHRLPTLVGRCPEPRLEPWIARKTAILTRSLGEIAVRVVDAALPEDLGEVSPARILDVVRAKVIEADPAAHAAALDAEKQRRYVSLGRTDEFGLRHILARVRAGDAAWIDAMVDHVADLLAPRYDAGTTRDVLRSEAFTWLARPAELLDLLSGGQGAGPAGPGPGWCSTSTSTRRPSARTTASPGSRTSAPSCPPRSPNGSATPTSPSSPSSIWPTRSPSTPTNTPNHSRNGSGSAAPPTPSPTPTASPAASTTTTSTPTSPATPPRPATTTPNPSRRTSHRAKTHLGYQVRQLGPGDYVWRTPHHRYRRVNHLGTTTLTEPIGSGFMSEDPIDRAVAQLTLDLATTGRAEIPGGLADEFRLAREVGAAPPP